MQGIRAVSLDFLGTMAQFRTGFEPAGVYSRILSRQALPLPPSILLARGASLASSLNQFSPSATSAVDTTLPKDSSAPHGRSSGDSTPILPQVAVAFHEALELLASRARGEPGNDAMASVLRVAVEEVRKTQPHFGFGMPGGSEAWWRSVITHVCELAPPELELVDRPSDLQVAALIAVYSGRIGYQAYPETAVVLQSLRRQASKKFPKERLRVAVLSNTDDRLDGVLLGLGLGHLVDVVVTSGGSGESKPSRAAFMKMLDSLNDNARGELGKSFEPLMPENILHIGDSVDKDYLGAQAAGMRSVLVLRDEDTAVEPVVAGSDAEKRLRKRLATLYSEPGPSGPPLEKIAGVDISHVIPDLMPLHAGY